jgi:hypothetical protein
MPVIGISPISIETLKEWIDYDPNTGELTWLKSPHHLIKTGDVAGSYEKRGYKVIQVKKRLIKGHRTAWAITHGYFPIGEIDHIDNNPSNNRIGNLREVNRSKNQMNTKTPKNNTSGVKGVHYCNPKRKWIASISIDKKKICIGHFTSIEEAIKARKQKEKDIHGEYALKN